MARFFKQRSGAKGARPGSLLLIGEQKTENVRITVMQYDSTDLIEKQDVSIKEALGMISSEKLTWINIFGIHDISLLSEIGQTLNIDNMILEDILNTDHRPKFYSQANLINIIAKLLTYEAEKGQIQSDQLSVIVGEDYVITLQEKPGNHFELVRHRIRNTPDRSRIHHSDYLAYALLDCMVDAYMDIIADLGTSIDNMEKEIFITRNKKTSEHIYRLRTELNFLRKIVLPLKELTFGFLKSDSSLITKDTRLFIADLHEHVIIVQDSVEVYFSLVADQLNIYNTIISNRANEIMRVLTVFAAFFIPLTFLVGIYGMNFQNMPELAMKHGYLYFWILIVVVSVSLTIYFRRKKWF